MYVYKALNVFEAMPMFVEVWWSDEASALYMLHIFLDIYYLMDKT